MPSTTEANIESIVAGSYGIGRKKEDDSGSSLGVFLTGEGKLEVLKDPIPSELLDGEHIILESLANIRCSSDEKARKQFARHARIPRDAKAVALGHECVQRVVFAPKGSNFQPGDIVLITPGHTTTPYDPQTLHSDPSGVLCALGYSYRHLGGLRRQSVLPRKLFEVVREQGFGELLSVVRKGTGASLASLAHAEPLGCCANAIRQVTTRARDGSFQYGIPKGARIAFLGGTARMAMVSLTIIAALPRTHLPRLVAVTGSARKLALVMRSRLARELRQRGVELLLFEREDSETLKRLRESGPFEVVFTNYASREVYEQAVAIVAPGGNVNNFAGAVDPELSFEVHVPAVERLLREDPRRELEAMHHPASASDPTRYCGVARNARVSFLHFTDERLRAYLRELREGAEVQVADGDLPRLEALFPTLRFSVNPVPLSDVFIGGSGAEAAKAYAALEHRLSPGAAVNFVDGGVTVRIRSKHLHYYSRHQLCGPTVPFYFTNTSEPLSFDLARQADEPIDFDWLLRGVSGLEATVELYDDVAAKAPFGSFLVLSELEGFPYVEVSAQSFLAKRRELEATAPKRVLDALRLGAEALLKSGDTWSRDVEEALYAAYGRKHPLS